MNEGVDRFSPHLNPYTVEVTCWGDYGVGDSASIAVDPAARRMARRLETHGEFCNKD